MEKEVKQDLFSTVNDQYNALELVDDAPTLSSEHFSAQTTMLRKYGPQTLLGVVDFNIGRVDANGHTSLIKSQLYNEYANVLNHGAQLLGKGESAQTYYKYAAFLYMQAAIESQGITEQNAHAVFHCLAQIADLNEENRVDK